MKKMKKIIRKVGDSKGIIFNKEECEVYNINIGDVFDLEICKTKPSIQAKGQKKKNEHTTRKRKKESESLYYKIPRHRKHFNHR